VKALSEGIHYLSIDIGRAKRRRASSSRRVGRAYPHRLEPAQIAPRARLRCRAAHCLLEHELGNSIGRERVAT
jgi:hypothetical protein